MSESEKCSGSLLKGATTNPSSHIKNFLDDKIAGLQQPANYVRELESLRGWAILLVVIFHYLGIIGPAYFWPFNQSETLIALANAGNSGVALFFVLSGFLLSRPFMQRIKQGQPITFLNFYRARALRILPLYLLVVSLAWIVTGKEACLKAMFFIPIVYEAYPFSIPWWSLSTEVQFYLVLPLLMLGLSFPHLRVGVLIALCAGLAIYAYFVTTTPILEQYPWLKNNLAGRANAFFAGGIAAWISIKRESRAPLSPAMVSMMLLASLTLLGALLCWYGKMNPRDVFKVFPLYHYAESALWAIVLFSLIQPGCVLKKIFCNPAFDTLGRISYSLYLLHLPLIFYMVYPALEKAKISPEFGPTFLAIVGASFVIMLIVAAASYHYIERPFLALKARRLPR